MRDRQTKNRIPPAAWILGICLAVLAAGSGVYLLAGAQRDAGVPRMIRISQNGAVLKEINLADVTDGYELEITGDNGAFNRLLIMPDGVQVTEASCPDHICMHTGKISDSRIPIVCLPNHLVIEVVSVKDGMDAVTY